MCRKWNCQRTQPFFFLSCVCEFQMFLSRIFSRIFSRFKFQAFMFRLNDNEEIFERKTYQSRAIGHRHSRSNPSTTKTLSLYRASCHGSTNSKGSSRRNNFAVDCAISHAILLYARSHKTKNFSGKKVEKVESLMTFETTQKKEFCDLQIAASLLFSL